MKYSHNNEQQYIEDILLNIDNKKTEYVDIGASDGIEMSNTLFLAQKKWKGFCVEYNTNKYNALLNNYKNFDSIKFSNSKVTPYNILEILNSNDVSKDFAFLNLDIDGYDYFVLDSLLSEYRPATICAEINEKIPPPVKFAVLYNESYSWNDAPFFGQSISQVQDLCNNHDYSIINVEYNNVFLIDNKTKHNIKTFTKDTMVEAWKSGYLNKPDRRTKFSHNNNFEPIYSMTAENSVKFIDNAFAKHKGRYIISI